MPNVSMDALREQPVTHIVSLGPRCATTYNLRRYYNFASAYPFDWWISPASGLIQVLTTPDADWIYDPEALRLTETRHSVLHAPSGLLLHHEFPREAGGQVRETFRDAIALPRERTRYLLAKFRELNRPGNRVVFVREEGSGPELEAVLATHFPDCDWALARIPSLPEDEHGWTCDPAAWDALLGTLRLHLDSRGHRPFEATVCEHVDGDFQPGAAHDGDPRPPGGATPVRRWLRAVAARLPGRSGTR